MRAPTKRPPGELTWADITGEADDSPQGGFLHDLGSALAVVLPASLLLALAVVGAVSLVP